LIYLEIDSETNIFHLSIWIMIPSQILALLEDITGKELTAMNSMLIYTPVERKAKLQVMIMIAMAFGALIQKNKVTKLNYAVTGLDWAWQLLEIQLELIFQFHKNSSM